jgi:hypothetical protein
MAHQLDVGQALTAALNAHSFQGLSNEQIAQIPEVLFDKQT